MPVMVNAGCRRDTTASSGKRDVVNVGMSKEQNFDVVQEKEALLSHSQDIDGVEVFDDKEEKVLDVV